jgi:transcription antitermination factor NusA-like protein
LIENSQVGGIIGKSGANVKRVRDDSGAFVSILKSDYRNVQERIMVLKGTPAQIAKAGKMLGELLIESSAQKEKRDGSSATSNDTAVIKFLVHKSAVGAVIGKAGANIKETQTETGARIQVSNEPLPQSTEKTVTLTGTPDALHSATLRIITQLRDNPLRPGTKVYPYVPGATVFGSTPFGLNGPYSASGVQSLYPSSIPYPAHSTATSTQKIAIPTVCAGCVIGKGGQVIRDLRAQSATNISIADPDPNSPGERVITLTGPPQGIQHAVFVIRQLVEQYSPPPHQGNGQGGHQAASGPGQSGANSSTTTNY